MKVTAMQTIYTPKKKEKKRTRNAHTKMYLFFFGYTHNLSLP